MPRLQPRVTRKLDALLAEAAAIARRNFHGPLTYAAAFWERVDWSRFDLVGVNLYRFARQRGDVRRTGARARRCQAGRDHRVRLLRVRRRRARRSRGLPDRAVVQVDAARQPRPRPGRDRPGHLPARARARLRAGGRARSVRLHVRHAGLSAPSRRPGRTTSTWPGSAWSRSPRTTLRAGSARPPSTSSRGSTAARSDLVARDQFAADDHALDLAGAFADQQQRRVAVEAFDLVFLGVAVAAVDPEGVLDDFLAGL